ncbi:MAG: P27 family phage terminase small subunit [Terriglobia bacterium]|jgi:P27 family predicted phage terminase small subunit
MAKGRKRVPAAVKIARGTFRVSRGAGIVAPTGDMSAPSWLCEEEAAAYREILAAAPAGLFRPLDIPALSRHCTLQVAFDLAREEFLAHAKGPKGEGESAVVSRGARGSLVGLPALKVMGELAAALRLSGAELGLTPGAREKITTDDQARLPLDKSDPWAALEVPTDGGRA